MIKPFVAVIIGCMLCWYRINVEHFSLAWKKVNSLTLTLSFVGDFPAISGVFKSDGLDFMSLYVAGTGCSSKIKLHILSRFINVSLKSLKHITNLFIGDQVWESIFFSIQGLPEN